MTKKKLLFVCTAAIICSCGSHKTIVSEKGNTNKGYQDTGIADKSYDNRNIEYKGKPWVKNMSTLSQPTKGLQNRHISLWASHGRYYNNKKDEWEWQRPYLFCTTEDLFTQTIVVPYLMPMLENAGATVFSPRERDWQDKEIIIDNDDTIKQPFYNEAGTSQKWVDAATEGFANISGNKVYGGSNPFSWGTTRKAKATDTPSCYISYQPKFTEAGRYAVYISYPTLKNSIDDAEYTVYHNGGKTVFHVNQRMGGGTWVYLGTFHFGSGCSEKNRVVLSNASEEKGVVTADAVRFGGGMGNINRYGTTSGLPRCLEGARYYAQWAGAPDSVYNSKHDSDDYKDDINTRSYMTNWLAGGSCYVPTLSGKKVPFDLSLAVHSDAGYANDMKSIYGSLSICTTNFHDGKLNSGRSRQCSKIFASQLLDGLKKDLTTLYGRWVTRDLYDKNYSETRCPEIPSAIIETLSHQSFPDMILGQDPNVKFSIARSLYKTILKFISQQNDKQFVVSPLSPKAPYITLNNDGTAEIGWQPQTDATEPSAKPSAYILYTAVENEDFDNGEIIKGNKTKIQLVPDVLYNFRITAINKGGESFPSETISAVYHPDATKTVLVINGFHRLSAPKVIDTDTEQGFDIDSDPGVTYGMTIGWSGRQTCFDKTKAGVLGTDGMGFSGNDLEGVFIQGNTFDYTRQHAKAIKAANKYNIVSSSSYAVENGDVNIGDYHCIDYIMGLERYNSHTPAYYKSIPQTMQDKLKLYTSQGGSLLISGAYIATDMQSDKEKEFLSKVLHIVGCTPQINGDSISGLGTSFSIYAEPNKVHYAVNKVDGISPAKDAFCAMTYQDGISACVAYDGEKYKSLSMGFPFECITSEKKQATIMKGLMKFLLK